MKTIPKSRVEGQRSKAERGVSLRRLGNAFSNFATRNSRPSTSISGFSLVEVVIAIGIAAFCLVAIFGLIPAGINTNNDSIRETIAASLASSIASDLRSTPSTTNSTFQYSISFPAAGSSNSTCFFLKDDGSSTNTASVMGVNYRAIVAINTPANRSASTARILITWPPLVDPSVSMNYGSFETVVSLDRN